MLQIIEVVDVEKQLQSKIGKQKYEQKMKWKPKTHLEARK